MARQKAPEINIETILSNPADAQTLRGFVEEFNLCQEKIRRENEAKKDIKTEVKEKLGIKGGAFAKYARAYEDVTIAEKGEAEWSEAAQVAEKLRKR